jgi:Phage integrase, N-terminal SAM-like domain
MLEPLRDAGEYIMETAIPRRINGFHARLENREFSVTPGAAPASPPKPKLLDQVRQAIRRRHYSDRTEKAYIHWIKRFIFFHNKRHPADMAETEIG